MTDLFVGTWELNPGKSEFDPNHRPAAATLIFELDAEGRYLMKAQGRKENGQTVTERPQQFTPDGQGHPLPEMPGLTVMTRWLDANSMQTEARREDGSVVGGGTYVVSADGQSLTVTNFGWDSQLRQFQQKTVWDRL